MKKVLFGILAMLVATAAVADFRIEVDRNGREGTAHIPFDANNTNNELKVTIERGGSIENPGAGEYAPSASGRYWAPRWTEATGLPTNELIEYTCEGTGNTLNANIDNTNFTCLSCKSMVFALDVQTFNFFSAKDLPTVISQPVLQDTQDGTIYWAIEGHDCTKN